MSLHIQAEKPPAFGELILHRIMPSRLDHKAELIDELVAHLTESGWVERSEEHWLTLCLDEVVVNAMLHGNEGEPTLEVELRLWGQDEYWILQVDDRGEGFHREQVPDPDDDSSLLLEHGRGILIMQQWLDELRYYRGGSCAVLIRRKHDQQEREA